MQGKKHDRGKNRLELIPPEMIEGLGEVLTHGAAKYGDHNWARGMRWSRYYGAALRHMNAFWSGQDHDTESGLLHLQHAACAVAFLIAYFQRGVGEDDRGWSDPDQPDGEPVGPLPHFPAPAGYRELIEPHEN